MATPETILDDAHPLYEYDQARGTPILGMWVFLVTEWLLFGGMFLAYAVYRYSYPAAFTIMSSHMELALGTVNTGILLTSSLSAALAAHFADEGRKNWLLLCLAMTAVLGLVFECLKGLEYYRHYAEGLVPQVTENHRPLQERLVDIFLWLYYIMTGLHALHVAIGVGVFVVLAIICWRRPQVSHHFATVVFISGLYWHFVDIIWIFLYPLIYLGEVKG